MIEIVKATDELIKKFVLQGDFREKDAYEWFVLSQGRKLADVLKYRKPDETWAALDETGYVLALWGFAAGPYDVDHLLGWLIGNDKGQLRARELHRHRKAIMAKETRAVAAYTLYRNDKWHAMLGFELIHEMPFPGDMGPSVYVYGRPTTWVS